MRALIRATGSCVPEKKLTNADLERIVETDDEWIRTRTGIGVRSVVAEGEATSDIATRAAREALASAGLGIDDVGMIIVATCTPDYSIPSTASLVQRNLCPNSNIPSIDLNAACSGFLYGLDFGSGLLASGRYERILLIGAEALTRWLDYEDRTTCVIFGDGAGAVILEDSKSDRGLLDLTLGADGEFWDLIHVKGGGTRHPASAYGLAQGEQYIRMDGRQTFRLAVPALERSCRETLDRVGWKVGDVDHLVLHQANRRIIDAVAQRLEIPPERVPVNIEHTGNTSAASIPVLLDECNRSGLLQPGDRVLCSAFGAGLTFGAAAIVW